MTNEGHIDVGHQDSGPILKKLAKEPKGQVYRGGDEIIKFNPAVSKFPVSDNDHSKCDL